MEKRDLKDHIWKSYFGLRILLGILGIFLPFYLWLGGKLFWGVPLQESISAYYHAVGGELRNEFVGVLISVAALLIAYRGYSRWENWILNAAGAFLVGVALIPKTWPGISDGQLTWLHGPLAIGFFLMVAYVAACRSWDTLIQMEAGWRRRSFEWLYRVLGVLMIALPGVVLAINLAAGSGTLLGHTVFWLEAVGIWSFGVFWLAKTYELRTTQYERRVFEGTLREAGLEGCRFCPPFCGRLKRDNTES